MGSEMCIRDSLSCSPLSTPSSRMECQEYVEWQSAGFQRMPPAIHLTDDEASDSLNPFAALQPYCRPVRRHR